MKFEIRMAENGAILRVDPGEGEPVEEVVFEDQVEGEIEAFVQFLHHLLDNYGPSTSRYSPKRIRISVEPGDKYTDTEQQAEDSQ